MEEKKEEQPTNEEPKLKPVDINDIYEFFCQELKLYSQQDVDISYKKWITQDPNLKKLCSMIRFKDIKEDVTTIYQCHDHDCEHKLIKWITEDKEHKERFLKIPKTKIKLNRDNNILPYNFNFATSNGEPLKEDSNYINASYISGPFVNCGDQNMFIATQAPLPDTIFSFWSTIKVNQIPLVIMLSNVTEAGRTKSEIYWPVEENQEMVVTNGEENISIVLAELQKDEDKKFIRRKFVVDNASLVEQIQILNWPDHSEPNNLEKFDSIKFLIDIVEKYINLPERLPIIVHCSAGVGRTGTFIALFNIIRCLKKMKELRDAGAVKEDIVPFFNVFNVVRKLREQRISMVSDKCQYKFIYRYILNWIKNNFK